MQVEGKVRAAEDQHRGGVVRGVMGVILIALASGCPAPVVLPGGPPPEYEPPRTYDLEGPKPAEPVPTDPVPAPSPEAPPPVAPPTPALGPSASAETNDDGGGGSAPAAEDGGDGSDEGKTP
ncbi:MAG: hypothetical protein AAF928_17635 [Myxococcota bacterium]